MAAFPVRAVYTVQPRSGSEPAARLLISVPKRHFKHAVDRNRVKRQLREAWRTQRQLLTDAVSADHSVSVALLWQTGSHLPTAEIQKRVATLLGRMARKVAATALPPLREPEGPSPLTPHPAP